MGTRRFWDSSFSVGRLTVDRRREFSELKQVRVNSLRRSISRLALSSPFQRENRKSNAKTPNYTRKQLPNLLPRETHTLGEPSCHLKLLIVRDHYR